MNMNGSTPFREATEYSDNSQKYMLIEDFVKKYMDENCSGQSVGDTGELYEVRFSGCGKDFKDPDGKPYSIKYVSDVEIGTSERLDATNYFEFGGRNYDGKMDYVFYAFSNASCGDEEGIATIGYDERDVAVFYILEGGEIACVDNH